MAKSDAVRGFERLILFEPTGGYKTSGGVAVSNCVVEVVPNDWQGRSPMLSLRFFNPATSHRLTDEWAKHGHHHYDENTQIGVEINLGPEIAQSLKEQIQAQWPEFVRVVNESPVAGDDEAP